MEILAHEMPDRAAPSSRWKTRSPPSPPSSAPHGAVAKTLTATSGPGFSLMQEGIGYASITETPCVIVNCQRWGPSTGQPTKGAQGDVMQSIWGTHGDHAIIVLTASNVRDAFDMTVRAFNFAEQYRVPVVLLLDEVLAHMRENITGRKRATSLSSTQDARRHQELQALRRSDAFLPFGAGARFHVTGLAHGRRWLSPSQTTRPPLVNSAA
jgi:2-oxoglutarate ferredoxin oxidoreductase subunit alpha